LRPFIRTNYAQRSKQWINEFAVFDVKYLVEIRNRFEKILAFQIQ